MDFYIKNQSEDTVAILSSDKFGEHTPVYSAIVDEKLESYDELTLTIPADSEEAGLIKEDNYIIFKDVKGWREYSIVSIEYIDNENIEMTITAELSSIELYDEVIEEELSGVHTDPEELLEAVLKNTRWATGYVDSSIYNSSFSEPTEFKNVLEILTDISSRYECEVQFSYQISGNKVINRFVNLYKQFGEDKGKRFEVDKDVTEIKRTIDIADIKTAIIAFGAEPEGVTETDEETGEEITSFPERLSLKNIEWKLSNGDPVDKPKGQSYIGSPTALANWGKLNPDGSKRHRFLSMEFDVETEEEMASMAWVQLNRYTSPKTTYEVVAIDLYTLTGDEDLKHEYANLGDWVIAIDNYFTNPIAVKKRVIEMTRDLIEPINNNFVFGDSKNLFSISGVSDKVDEIKNQVNKTINKLTNVQVSIDGKTQTFRGSKQPIGMIEGDIWFRPNPLVVGEKQLLVFNGVTWEIQADTADLSDAGRLKIGELDAGKIRVINLTADDIQGGNLDLAEGLTITNNGAKVMSVNASTGAVEMNVSKMTINAKPVATTADISGAISDIKIGASNLLVTHDEWRNFWLNGGEVYPQPSVSNFVIAVSRYLIPVTSGEQLTFTKKGDETALNENYWRISWLDSDNSYISRTTNPSNNFTLIVPSGISFLWACYPPDANAQIERGNIATDWTYAPEDEQADLSEFLDGKADQLAFEEALEDLALAKSLAEDALNSGTYADFIAGYDSYKEAMEIDKGLAESALNTVRDTVVSIENNLGDSAEQWNFIQTSITNSEQGILITNEGSPMGVMISNDRISFYDNGVEVAFISDKVLQINHGIFVQSAQIGAHLITSLPENPEITVVQWVGFGT